MLSFAISGPHVRILRCAVIISSQVSQILYSAILVLCCTLTSNTYIGKPARGPLHPDYVPSIFSFKSAAPTQCSSRYSRSVRRAKSKQDACKSDITQATRVSEISADSEQCEGDQVNASEIGNGVRQEVGGVIVEYLK